MNCMTKLNFGTIFSIFGASKFGEYLNKAAEIKFAIELQKIPECMECCRIIRDLKSKGADAFPEAIKDMVGIIVKYRHGPENADISAEAYQIMINYLASIISTFSLRPVIGVDDRNFMHDAANSFAFRRFTVEQYDNLISKMNELLNNIYGVNIELASLAYGSLSESKIMEKFYEKINNLNLGASKASKYLFKCGSGDCKGFVEFNGRCSLCNHVYCTQCFKDITDESSHSSSTPTHTCKEEDLLTAKEIMNSTKACPNCASRIFKISGCSQMFCTNCHIGFDYNTGKIIKHDFHNPHRMEWLQSNGGRMANNEAQCNPEHIEFIHNPYLMYRLYQLNHVRSLLNKINRKEILQGKTLFQNRCKFILNRMSDVSFKDYLRKAELDKYKDYMLNQIYTEFIDTAQIIISTAHRKDVAAERMMLEDDITFNLYKFVVGNNLTAGIQKLNDTQGCSKQFTDYCKLIETIIRYHEQEGQTTVIPPNCEFNSLLTLTYRNREYIALFDTFEEENHVFNELVKHINDLLVKYKAMFKISSVSLLSPIGHVNYMYRG